MVQDIINDHFLWSPPFCYLMSHDASWGIVAKLGTRAIQRRRLHVHAMYGCWIMHEITLIAWPVTCGRDYLPITSACGAMVPTLFPMFLSNAQILRRGRTAGGWSRCEDTLEECNRARVLSICPLQHVHGPCRFARCATSSFHWVTDPACSRWPA